MKCSQNLALVEELRKEERARRDEDADQCDVQRRVDALHPAHEDVCLLTRLRVEGQVEDVLLLDELALDLLAEHLFEVGLLRAGRP